MVNIGALSLEERPKLESLPLLPLDILLIIFSHLDTARTVASLGATCKTLHKVVKSNGWRVFVRSHFPSLQLPASIADKDWRAWGRDLTWQSRAWDRRAFTLATLVPPVKQQQQQPQNARGHSNRFRAQTVPCHIVVDAKVKTEGRRRTEIVAWGAGEDVTVRSRQIGRSASRAEQWTSIEGSSLGFTSGKDDVTSIYILDSSARAGAGLVVGRASGDLRLHSLDPDSIGQATATLRPQVTAEPGLEQREIQSCDFDSSQNTLAVNTKDSTLLYRLGQQQDGDRTSDGVQGPDIDPSEALSLRAMPGSKPFKFLRSVKFMGNGDLALGVASSLEPLRYLTPTPSGLELVSAAKMQPSDRCIESYLNNGQELETVRDILPVSAGSMAGGRGSVVLSSYDDGTVRLQDLRTSSAIDTIYQDHFEVMTPVGPLAAYGTERFIAGSARSAILKIFDFRWTKGYCYTDALPCGAAPLLPTPKPPTVVSPPYYSGVAGRCDHMSGRLCQRHALSRTDFYRPNCSIYLPLVSQLASPVYSLAKVSDSSPTVYAGLAGELVEMNLRDSGESRREPAAKPKRQAKQARAGYSYHESLANMLETGDGIALADVSKSQRVPEIRKQAHHSKSASMQGMYRLDDLFVSNIQYNQRGYASDDRPVIAS
ncbi:hypothetical protein JX265_001255 [Neoarthrinium moseri]|uniref:F-box domain-containing protein n=1 Tax=Neoarthrinium moseri TaxID=1658444 RepID=A0A9P9WXG1_9PEZI|nr:hypothetical protein JX265_001255 [Neoarthrinium moseri]